MIARQARVKEDLDLLMSNLLALDQSSRTTGYAIFKDGKLYKYGHFTYEDSNFGLRLNKIRKKVLSLINEFDINEIAFEDIYMDGQKINNVQTFKALAEVFGVLYELFTDLQIPNTAILAGTWKSTLNIKGIKRTEQKQNAQKYVLNEYNIKATQDECDAICIGSHYIQTNKPAFDWSD